MAGGLKGGWLSRSDPQMASTTLIQKTQSGPADKTYFDMQVFLDPFEGKAASLLAYALPVEYDALMPISWDAEVQHLRMKATKYLGVEDTAVPDGTLAGQLSAVGNSRRADVYGTVRRILKNALDSGWRPTHEDLQPLDNRALKVNPLKLYLYAQAYAANAVVETEAADRFGLTLDKLALLTVMHLLFHPDILGVSLSDPTAVTSSKDLNRAVARRLTQKPGSRAFSELTSILLLDAGVLIEFPQTEWVLTPTEN